MSELTRRIKQKYPQYQNMDDGELEQKVLAKYPEYQNLTGLGGWLTEGKKGLKGAFQGLMNVVNLPSYFTGGILGSQTDARESLAASGERGETPTKQDIKRASEPLNMNSLFSRAGRGLEGVKNKRALFSEAPRYLEMEPGTLGSTAIGLGAELLLPDPDYFGKIGDAYRGLRGTTKAGGVTDDLARTFLKRSYKLNDTDINKIAEAIGVTDEAQKATKVVDYLEELGLQGASKKSLDILGNTTSELQKVYDDLVRTGKPISRQDYAEALFDRAAQLDKIDQTAEGRSLVNRLLEEAEFQYQNPRPLTDASLTSTKTSAFQRASNQAINQPFKASFNEQLGRAGVNTLEDYAPGSSTIGKKLRGTRTAQGRLGSSARKGIGSQLFNMFKPSAAGAGLGAAYGFGTGRDPLESAAIGAGVGIGINNPRVQNIIGKNLPGVVNAGKNVLNTGIRVVGQGQNTAVNQGNGQQRLQTNRLQRTPATELINTYPTNSTPSNTQIKLFSDRNNKKRRIF